METLEALLREHNPKGQLIRSTAKKMAITLNELHKQDGKIEDSSGLAVKRLYEPIKDEIESGQSYYGSAFLSQMEAIGVIKLVRKGKRTFSIEVVGYPPDVDKWLPEGLKARPLTEAEASVALDGETQYVGPDSDDQQEITVIQPDEEAILGGRPGRLAARIEKSIPDIVTLAVSQALDTKFDQMIRGMGYVPATEAVVDNHHIQETLKELNEQVLRAREELRVERQLHEYTRAERNAALARGDDRLQSGSLRPSQLHKDLQEVGQWALDNGFAFYRTDGGHIVFRHKDGGPAIYSASTPSDYRGTKNLEADLKRVLREIAYR